MTYLKRDIPGHLSAKIPVATQLIPAGKRAVFVDILRGIPNKGEVLVRFHRSNNCGELNWGEVLDFIDNDVTVRTETATLRNNSTTHQLTGSQQERVVCPIEDALFKIILSSCPSLTDKIFRDQAGFIKPNDRLTLA